MPVLPLFLGQTAVNLGAIGGGRAGGREPQLFPLAYMILSQGVSLKYNRAKPAYTPAGVADSGNAFLPLSHKYLSIKFTRKFLNVNTAFHPLSGSSFNLPVINGLESTPCHSSSCLPFCVLPCSVGIEKERAAWELSC